MSFIYVYTIYVYICMYVWEIDMSYADKAFLNINNIILRTNRGGLKSGGTDYLISYTT